MKTEKYQFNEKESASQNLFLWALLHNRMEIARIFWRTGKVKFIY